MEMISTREGMVVVAGMVLLGALLLGWLMGMLCARPRRARLEAEVNFLEREKEGMAQRLEEMRAQRESDSGALKNAFESLSAKLLEESSSKLKTTNKEQMDALLTPLHRQIESLGRSLHDSNVTQAVNKKSFEEIIKQMMEKTDLLSTDATNLARALKGDSKVQGDWGELVLERMLEESGLRRDEEYYVQEDHVGEDGKHYRPDVVVRFPDKRCVVIDSKVSLTAYTMYMSTQDDAQRQKYLADHVASVRHHIEELWEKDYSGIVKESVGYVLMFIPNEASYIAALQMRPDLPMEGYKKRVLLISPSNLIMALQLVYHLWQKERQTRNVESIFKKASAIYDKAALVQESFEEIGKHLDKAAEAYRQAQDRFNAGKGNFARQLEDLRTMGVSPNKNLKLADDQAELDLETQDA